MPILGKKKYVLSTTTTMIMSLPALTSKTHYA